MVKLPFIFKHFAEHKKEDKNISALKFLSIHYLHGSPTDKDYDKDMQLPFKTSEDCISSISPAFVPVPTQFVVLSPIEINTRKVVVQKDQSFLTSYLANIWQPPKSC